MNYNAESSNMSNSNTELRIKYAEDLLALGNGLGTEWFQKQDEVNEQFTIHFGERADGISKRISGNVLDASLVVDNSFANTSIGINALVVVDDEDNNGSFIDKANYYINYHNETLAVKSGEV